MLETGLIPDKRIPSASSYFNPWPQKVCTILNRTFIHTWASIYMHLLSMLYEGNGRYCMPRWPDCGACTSAHCKLLMLNYWNVAEEGMLELWRERSLGSSEKQRNASLETSRIILCETWNIFYFLAAIYLFVHENITSFLSCRFQKACQCQILIECLETITV